MKLTHFVEEKQGVLDPHEHAVNVSRGFIVYPVTHLKVEVDEAEGDGNLNHVKLGKLAERRPHGRVKVDEEHQGGQKDKPVRDGRCLGDDRPTHLGKAAPQDFKVKVAGGGNELVQNPPGHV